VQIYRLIHRRNFMKTHEFVKSTFSHLRPNTSPCLKPVLTVNDKISGIKFLINSLLIFFTAPIKVVNSSRVNMTIFLRVNFGDFVKRTTFRKTNPS